LGTVAYVIVLVASAEAEQMRKVVSCLN